MLRNHLASPHLKRRTLSEHVGSWDTTIYIPIWKQSGERPILMTTETLPFGSGEPVSPYKDAHVLSGSPRTN